MLENGELVSGGKIRRDIFGEIGEENGRLVKRGCCRC